ncbi:MAG: NUDIX domain-containing protein [Solirubrobacteraceae bacterium]
MSVADRPPDADEHSAGGVVLRGKQVLVIVPKRRASNGERVLALPKGHLDGDESAEQAAVREVREEGGVDAELLESLGDVRYRYKRDGRLVDKRVTFFLFAYRSGTPADHDHEIVKARWMATTKALTQLTYPGEREMVAAALSKTRPDR